MAQAFGIKYILSILDFFSWKGYIYGTNTKKGNILLSFVIDFWLNHNIPKEFISDNVAEFKNIFFNEFCSQYNIKSFMENLIPRIARVL